MGETCYLSCVAQVLIRTPDMLEWLKQHVADGCRSGREGSCVLCSLKQTYDQMLNGTVGRAPMQPVIAQRRQTVGPEFIRGQHDAVDFMEQFLERAKQSEVARQRYGLWGGLQQTHPVATQVDRLFSHVQETRRQCTYCGGAVRSWYANEPILRVSPVEADGGPLTMSELYFASCAASESSVDCPLCQRETSHRTQVRMMTAPNVLAIQVRRKPGARVPVAVEQQLDLPGFPLMELIGVVYHNGRSFSSGHYTCLCRGPGGRFWSYDDLSVHREDRDISHIKPKQVVLVVYGRGDGGATLAQVAAEVAENVVVAVDEAVAALDAEPQAVPSSSSYSSPRRRLSRKTSCEVPAPGPDVAMVPESQAASTPSRAPAACSVVSPCSRRLSRKTSATDAFVRDPPSAVSPDASALQRGIAVASDTGPGAALASPCSRRLTRKTSAAEACSPAPPIAESPRASGRRRDIDQVVGGSTPAVVSSPSTRRLRRKTSVEELAPGAEDAAPVASAPLAGARVADAPAQPVQGRGVGMLRRGRGHGRQAGSEDHCREAGVSRQGDAADWFLAAADLGGSTGAAPRSRDGDQNGLAPTRRQGVVSGFGAERTEDALGDRERRDRESNARARVRRDEFVRDRVVHFMSDNDLDRSFGGAWSGGRR